MASASAASASPGLRRGPPKASMASQNAPAPYRVRRTLHTSREGLVRPFPEELDADRVSAGNRSPSASSTDPSPSPVARCLSVPISLASVSTMRIATCCWCSFRNRSPSAARPGLGRSEQEADVRDARRSRMSDAHSMAITRPLSSNANDSILAERGSPSGYPLASGVAGD